MISRENTVTLLFATAGLRPAYGGRVVTRLSDTILIGLLIFIGIVTPQVLIDILLHLGAEESRAREFKIRNHASGFFFGDPVNTSRNGG